MRNNNSIYQLVCKLFLPKNNGNKAIPWSKSSALIPITYFQDLVNSILLLTPGSGQRILVKSIHFLKEKLKNLQHSYKLLTQIFFNINNYITQFYY